MTEAKEKQVRELHEQGLSQRQIAEKTGIPKSTVGLILKEAEAEAAPTPPTPAIQATGQQWKTKLNPWINLIHQAAVEQIAECRGISLEDFIYHCCDFAKRVFKLHPPGWAMETEQVLDVSEPEGWDLPQVKAAAKILEREAENGRQLVGASVRAAESESSGGEAGESGQPGEREPA